MTTVANDRWRGVFSVPKAGRYRYTMEGWIDRFSTWRDGPGKRIAAGQDVHIDLLVGAELVDDAAGRAKGAMPPCCDRGREGYAKRREGHGTIRTERDFDYYR
jgi:hypothetical protein